MSSVQSPAAPRAPGSNGSSILERLATAGVRAERLRHVEELAPRKGVHSPWPAWVPEQVRSAYAARGIEQPWAHQVAAADAAWSGRHVEIGRAHV